MRVYASVAGRHTLWRKEQRCPPTIFVAYTLYTPTNNAVFIKYRTKNLLSFIKSHINVCFQNLFYPFSILAAIHLFISSHDEIEDFCSMDKKTGRRYGKRIRISTKIITFTFKTMFLFSHLYMRVYASVAGLHTLWRKEQRCPSAIFVVYTLYTPTNNADYIKYRAHTPNTYLHLNPRRKETRK